MNWIVFLAGALSIMAIYVIATLAIDLQFSYANIINFGIVAYVAVGAYTFAILSQPTGGPTDDYRFGFGLPVPIALLGAAVVSGLCGLVTAWPALRLRGEYVALVTFAFAEVLRTFIENSNGVTNGLLGLTVERPFQTALTADGQVLGFAVMALLFAALAYLFIRILVRSQFGRLTLAVSDDEVGATAIGKNVVRNRLQVFVVGSVLMGLSGGLYAMYLTFITPAQFSATMSFTVFIALVLGGVRHRYGAVLGVTILIGFQEAVSFLNLSPDSAALVSSLRISLTGILLVIILRIRPPENVLVAAARRKQPEAQPKGMEVRDDVTV